MRSILQLDDSRDSDTARADNIESGAVKNALDQLAKVFKKQKDVAPMYKALKALALARSGRDEDEAHALCDELLALQTLDEQLLTVTEQALLELDRRASAFQSLCLCAD